MPLDRAWPPQRGASPRGAAGHASATALLLASSLVASLLGGCAESGPGPAPGPTPAPSAGPTPTPADLCAGITPVAGQSLALREVARGLSQPLALISAPGDLERLFVVEQRGRIRILAGGVLRSDPFVDLSDRVGCCGERGLLSLAFHPGYASNRRFFVYYTDTGGDIRISELVASGDDSALATSERVLLTIEHSTYSNHNGGTLAFGRDGMLYASVGDGGGAGDPLGSGQDLGTPLGKMLRLDVDSGAGLAAAGNPHGDLIWHHGLRNPWRFSFDRATGDLYIGDVGQNAWEEINFVPAGQPGGLNFGWSAMEGDGHCRNDPGCNSRGITRPVLEYPTGSGCSVTGGHVYRGCAMPDLRGTYFYGDFCAGFVRSFRIAGGAVSEPRELDAMLGSVAQLASFGEDARGEIYVVSLAGTIHRIEPR